MPSVDESPDWSSAGLPIEGKRAAVPRLGQLGRQDVPLARLSDLVGEVAKRAKDEGWDTALVVNSEGILLGRLFKSQLEEDPRATRRMRWSLDRVPSARM